jgi:hypothetical protein
VARKSLESVTRPFHTLPELLRLEHEHPRCSVVTANGSTPSPSGSASWTCGTGHQYPVGRSENHLAVGAANAWPIPPPIVGSVPLRGSRAFLSRAATRVWASCWGDRVRRERRSLHFLAAALRAAGSVLIRSPSKAAAVAAEARSPLPLFLTPAAIEREERAVAAAGGEERDRVPQSAQ